MISITTTSSTQRRVFARVIPKPCAEPRTDKPTSNLTASPNAVSHCIQFNQDYRLVDPVELQNPTMKLLNHPESDGAVVATKRVRSDLQTSEPSTPRADALNTSV